MVTIGHSKLALGAIFVAFVALELLTRRDSLRDRKGDLFTDLFCCLVVPGLMYTGVLFAAEAGAKALAPGAAGALATWPPWAAFALLLVGEDLTQYLWHRACHTVPGLYALHRAHHSAPYLNTRVVYRNSLLYYLFMPSLWVVGVLLYLGLGPVYAIYLIVKMTVIFAAHSCVPWDAPLYRWRLTRPLMWVVERVLSTPSTHACHHGLHADDGVTHYKGNYGNLLFLWDVLFGTAHITRQRPTEFGIEELDELPPMTEVLWPWASPARTPGE